MSLGVEQLLLALDNDHRDNDDDDGGGGDDNVGIRVLLHPFFMAAHQRQKKLSVPGNSYETVKACTGSIPRKPNLFLDT